MITHIIKKDNTSDLMVGDTVRVLETSDALSMLQKYLSYEAATDMLKNNFGVEVVKSDTVSVAFQIIRKECVAI